MRKHYENILVAVDGSVEADEAFNQAIEMVKDSGANLILAHVVDTRTNAIEAYDHSTSVRATEFAENLMARYKEVCTQANVTKVEYIIEYGSPKIIITKDIAKTKPIDLIICGATGLNAVERFLIGSVSEYITRHAPCDVLVVRPNKSAKQKSGEANVAEKHS